jgi:hypothetical protein
VSSGGAAAAGDLETVIEGLVDVPTIMQSMPRAIVKAAQMASS